MSQDTQSQKSRTIVVDGLRITPDLVSILDHLKSLDGKNVVAESCLFIAGLEGDSENIDKFFYHLQKNFYSLLEELSKQNGGGHDAG